MSKKLEKNGMWESSRMMLPEHRESLLQQNRDMKKQIEPELEEQQQEEIARSVDTSFKRSRPMTFIVFNELQNRDVKGIVKEIDTEARRVLICNFDDEEWIYFSDIIEVYGKS